MSIVVVDLTRDDSSDEEEKEFVGKKPRMDPDITETKKIIQVAIKKVEDLVLARMERKGNVDSDGEKLGEVISQLQTLKDSLPGESMYSVDDAEELPCCICLIRKREIVFNPCGHLVLCLTCPRESHCCICRASISTHIVTLRS